MFGYFVHTGCTTPLDMILQTWPGTPFKKTIATIAQQKYFLKLDHGFFNGHNGRKRAKIFAFLNLGPSMFFEAWIGMIPPDENIGEGFIVLEEDIVMRPELLNQ